MSWRQTSPTRWPGQTAAAPKLAVSNYHSFPGPRMRRNQRKPLPRCHRRITRILMGFGRLRAPVVPIRAHCPRGSSEIIIRGGSGQVDSDGTLHSVGAGNGMTLTAVGQLSGNTGSGTFNRSDGCVGSWIAIKRETFRGRRP